MDLQDYRKQFKHTQEGIIFMNHSGVSPMPDCCMDAMKQSLEQGRIVSDKVWPAIVQEYGKTRQAISRLLKVSPDEVAFALNTTDGINWVANGLDWNKGDRIVTVDGEYPANMYPWMNVAKRYGLDLHLIKPQQNRVTADMVQTAINDKTRIVAISFVDFVTGFRADLESIGKVCKENNVLFMVDLIQGAGVLPIDLKKWQVDFAVGGCQKWLMGPQGIGYFYIAKEMLDRVWVCNVGANTVKEVVPYRDYDFTLKDTAARFEYGTLPTNNVYGMRAVLEFLLNAGEDFIAERIHLITDKLVEGLHDKGFECHSPRSEDEWSGIVSFTHPKHSAEELANKLWQNNIFAREREGYLRIAPHFYNTEEEVQKLVKALG